MVSQSAAKKSTKKDSAWKYGIEVQGPLIRGRHVSYVTCKFCDKRVSGGISRFKSHIGQTHKGVSACPNVPPDVKQEILTQLHHDERSKTIEQQNFEYLVNGGSQYHAQTESEPTPTATSDRGIRGPIDRFMNSIPQDQQQHLTPNNDHRKKVCLDIGRFFFENGLSFNVANSPSFANMVRSIGEYGRGLKPPSVYDLSTWVLKEEVKSTNTMVDAAKRTWEETGVTIMSDGWTDIRKRQLINFLVNNPDGTVFLKTVDASKYVKDARRLFKMLDAIVEEVGEEHVVQVVTDNAAAYKAAGDMLMQKRRRLYWTPCAAHCIDLILEKLFELPQMKNAYLKAKRVANYIYSHGYVLAMMRRFTKRELIRPGDTRFATANLTLQSLLENKASLEDMFTSNKWKRCSWANTSEGKAVKRIIMRDAYFWPGLVYSLKATKPLVGVLRLVDSEATPAMGFIYGAMDKAKEKIARNFNNEEPKYKEIWEIIDKKWDFQMHRDLHAAGYFLNPQFQYEDDVSTHPEIRSGLYNCMEKLLPREDVAEAHMDLDKYLNREGHFGRLEAETTRNLKTPARWWQSFGMGVPILQRFAIRILSLTCSASGCERNWSTFNQVHTKRRNRLHTAKLNALVYVMYNKRLRMKFLQKRVKLGKKDEDILVVDEIPSDDEWLVDSPQVPENQHEHSDDDWEDDFGDDDNVMAEVQTTWQKDLEELDLDSLQIDPPQTDQAGPSSLPTQQRRGVVTTDGYAGRGQEWLDEEGDLFMTHNEDRNSEDDDIFDVENIIG